MRYLEKAVCVLSELESANFLGRLIPYEDEILNHLSETLFIVEDRPHHLIISLPSVTLRVCPLSRIFLFRFNTITPPTIQPQIDAWHQLTRQY